MKKISTKSISLNGNTFSFNVPPYSKALHFTIENNVLYMLYEYPIDTFQYIDDMGVVNEKIIVINIVEGLDIDMFTPPKAVYHSTVKNINTAIYVDNNNTNRSILNMETHNLFFHIFVEEIKGISEARDEKLNELI